MWLYNLCNLILYLYVVVPLCNSFLRLFRPELFLHCDCSFTQWSSWTSVSNPIPTKDCASGRSIKEIQSRQVKIGECLEQTGCRRICKYMCMRVCVHACECACVCMCIIMHMCVHVHNHAHVCGLVCEKQCNSCSSQRLLYKAHKKVGNIGQKA